MKLLLYCTKAKPYLFLMKENKPFELNSKCSKYGSLNGKIVAECDFEIEEFDYRNAECLTHKYLDLLNKSCLTDGEFFEYLQGKNGYAIYIKNLKVFDEPSEISSYYQLDKKALKENEYEVKAITKAPQNMMYCEDGLETKVIISIRPEWLCKILNGEKTIEVRKKVLKEMLENESMEM